MNSTFTRKTAVAAIFCLAQVSSVWAQNKPLPLPPTTLSSSSSVTLAGNGLDQGPLVPEGVEIVRAQDSKLPVFIKGRIAQKGQQTSRKAASSPQEASFSYLRELKAALQIVEPDQEFAVAAVQTDNLNQTHVKMKQQYRGVPVYGSEVYLHAKENQVSLLNGQYFPTPSLVNVIPLVSEQTAIKTALAAEGKNTLTSHQHQTKSVLTRQQSAAELVIYHPKRNLKAERLTWHVTVKPDLIHRWEYFIDAESGAVLHKYNHLCSIDGPKTATSKDLNNVNQTVNTYQKGSVYYLIDASRPMFNTQSDMVDNGEGALYTLDLKNGKYGDENATMYYVTSTNNAWSSPTSVSAHYNAGVAYEYFRTKHGRNAIDGEGGTIVSIINVKDEEGEPMDNAFWNGDYILYGNGDTNFKPLAGALDVAGHELTHGVIQYTANLEYESESGAINESMADVFGTLIENKNWLIGEDIVKVSQFPSGALRSMQDPHNGGTSLADYNNGYQPAHMNEKYLGDQDNGGVHVNSGIPNKAFYLFATAPGMTKDKAGRVYYRALNLYLTRLSQFTDLRYAVVQAATDLYGGTSPEVTAAKNAFTAVGIVEPGTGPREEGLASNLPLNPGADFVLYMGGSDNTLRIYNMATNTPSVVTNTPIKGKPSITDNGTVAYFVAQNGTIKAVNLQGAVNERVIDSRTIWDNVAVSKDGTMLAAVKTAKEPIIHIVTLATSQWTSVEVKNNVPFNQGETITDIHSLEWNHTGEKILLDGLYSYAAQSSTKEYWNIALANVWNKATGTVGNGEVEKFVEFTSDVINPSFSKNSPHNIAFDYISRNANNPSDVTYLLVTMNLKTHIFRSIFGNKEINHPSFSRTDDRIIFSARSGTSLVTGALPLAEDKLLTTGNAVGIIGDSKWAVWYAQGNRNLLASEEDVAVTANVAVFPNPFNTELSVSFEYKGKGAVTAQLVNMLGQEVKTFVFKQPTMGINQQKLSLQDLPTGPYILRLSNAGITSSYRLIKK